jgi:hypothetical protein
MFVKLFKFIDVVPQMGLLIKVLGPAERRPGRILASSHGYEPPLSLGFGFQSVSPIQR